MDTFRNFPLISLLEATLRAFGRIFQQAGGFFRNAFGGESGVWLGAAVAILVAAVAVHIIHARMAARHPQPPRPRGGAYFVLFGLLAVALAVLLLARWTTDFAQPGQTPLFFMLAMVVGLHLFWFVGDFASHATRWKNGGRFFEKILRNRTAYYMVLPTFILLGTFLYLPAVTIFYYSFFEYDIGGTKEWIAFGNYARLVSDEIFWKSMGNMAVLTMIGVSLSLAVPLVVAELIFHLRTERMRYYLRAAFLVPMVVPGVIIFLIWGYFYSDAGLIPLFGHAVGLGDRLEGLLSRPPTALYAVIFVGFPFVGGINLLIFYAGLSNIDESVWEAARMDGASTWRRFVGIDLPLLLRQFKLLLILGIIGGVQAFENVLVMTQGGPGWETMLPGLYMYRSALSFGEYGFACAVGVILFLLVLVASLVVNRGVPASRA
jgi:raffinose/stachyose/melibiose transport system permease protein